MLVNISDAQAQYQRYSVVFRTKLVSAPKKTFYKEVIIIRNFEIVYAEKPFSRLFASLSFTLFYAFKFKILWRVDEY